MPSRHDEIRVALSRGFSVDNLRAITKISIEAIQEGHLKHPGVFYAIASISRWIADAWDGVAVTTSVALRVEEQIKPSLLSLLESADEDSAEVCRLLDNLTLAFRDAILLGLDEDF